MYKESLIQTQSFVIETNPVKI